jgi:hypothetical protein
MFAGMIFAACLVAFAVSLVKAPKEVREPSPEFSGIAYMMGGVS